jgi:phosphatidylglycerophosphate synthase
MLKTLAADVRTYPSLASLTLGRLVFIPPLVFFICSGAQFAAAGFLAAFLVADHLDGVIARRVNADGPTRRALDSISDRIAIWSVYATMVALTYAALPIVLILAARDLYCARLCYRVMRSRLVAIGADWPYRVLSALLAAWVIAAPTMAGSARTASLGLVALFSVVVAIDLRLAVARVLAMPGAIKATVIHAGTLRSYRPDWATAPTSTRGGDRSSAEQTLLLIR